MPAPSFPLPINALTDHVHVAGDSLIFGAGNTPPMGYLWHVTSLIDAGLMARSGPAAGIRASKTNDGRAAASNMRRVPPRIAWTQNGISGSTLQDLADDVDTRIMDYAPAGDGSNWVVFIDVSPNDWGNAGLPTYWTDPADTILATIRGAKPNARVCFISSILGFGEKWQSGPTCWGLNTDDNLLEQLNDVAETWCAANDVWYMNLRGEAIADPFTIASYESTHNGVEPGATAGPITHDGGIHPYIYAGQIIVSQLVFDGWLDVDYSA